MDDSRALAGLLDRLAEVRQINTARKKFPSRLGAGFEADAARVRAGSPTESSDRLRFIGLGRGGRAVHGPSGTGPQALIGTCIRHTYSLVSEFRSALESRADAYWLGILAQAVRHDAAVTFDTAARVTAETPEFTADKLRCLDELDALVRATRGQGPRPSEHELLHAMDGLIVQLVRL
jgi:hypothetical protein